MSEDSYINIGHNLRMIRKFRGLSQAALGKSIGVSGQMIQKYETGQSQVSSKTLHLLADKLNVDIRQFFDSSEAYVDLSEEDGSAYELELNSGIKELIRVYVQLSNDDQERLIALATALINRKNDR
ncbi:helix-turn-helix domain-containing protein [Candidatus Odyssella thessalonicensis]|uniref:helix-turn-helix domain-containing protein n=1 Tax=Candidatus Odyssella thessalonicensis TaxID=84647 RepID=UPI000225C1D9|nr:helix-turn-helix transcriptional regulator [Candidatus Odyssella thessalonicensis]